MPSEKAQALVLRTTDWSETSRIAALWTREFGKVRALAKGGRRLKSNFENALDLLTYCGIVFLRKSPGSLDLLTEAQVVRRFPRLRTDLAALYAAYYVAELLEDMTEEHDPHPLLFDAALETLDYLGSPRDAANRPSARPWCGLNWYCCGNWAIAPPWKRVRPAGRRWTNGGRPSAARPAGWSARIASPAAATVGRCRRPPWRCCERCGGRKTRGAGPGTPAPGARCANCWAITSPICWAGGRAWRLTWGVEAVTKILLLRTAEAPRSGAGRENSPSSPC